jgi:lysophospholipase L1-like esterase
MKYILLWLTLLLLAGCSAPLPAPQPTSAPLPTLTIDPVSYRYLALGDSYTIGEGVALSQRYPVLLTGALRAQGLPMEDPLIVAQNGWTTDELDAGIDAADPQGTFDLVTLLIGVNNQFRGRSVEEYRLEFRGLLQRAIAFAGGDAARVIVLSIPDWSVMPAAGGMDELKIAAEIDSFNAVNRDETQKAGARFVNVTEISRLAIEDFEMVARDGLHPTGKMYKLWVEKILPEAQEILDR